MRNPRPENFDPKVHTKQRNPDPIDMTGVIPLVPKQVEQHSIFDASPTVSAVSETPTVTPKEDTNRNDVVSRYRGGVVSQPVAIPLITSQEDLMKMVRKAVKAFGKEAATHRFTQAEKQMIAEVVYAYKGQGIRTSENEITRIAINYLYHEYKLNGQNSILHKSLLALNE